MLLLHSVINLEVFNVELLLGAVYVLYKCV